jgi:hypothetical protein
MELLLFINRIDVAASRAKGILLVIGTPRLWEAKCEIDKQMPLVSTLCVLNDRHDRKGIE